MIEQIIAGLAGFMFATAIGICFLVWLIDGS